MDILQDPELEKLFKDELDERSKSLIEGARAMADGEAGSEVAGTMLREGHTIKGTGRVMGYEAVARGGETSELVWRWIQQGRLEPSSMLARTLQHLAEAIPGALSGEERSISVAIDAVRALVIDEELLEMLPNPLADEDDSDTEASADSTAPEDVPDEPVVEDATLEEAPTRDDESADPASGEDVVPDAHDATGDGSDSTAVDPENVGSDDDEHRDIAIADDDAWDALIFEPGPDGRLPTPVITYEIVSSAFAEAPVPTDADAKEPKPAEVEPAPSISIATLEESAALDEPPKLVLVDDMSSLVDGEHDTYDLGGLLGAVETWAAEESVPVNAGRLFRLINDVAALRIDVESAVNQAADILQKSNSALSTGAVAGSLEALESLRKASATLQSGALGLTMMPVETVIATLPQLSKYLAKRVRREIALTIDGADTLVDRQLVDRIGEIIRQLVVNAVAHGIEPVEQRLALGKTPEGAVKVSLSRDDQNVQIVVKDDGSGIDWTAVRERALAEGLVEGHPSDDELRSILYLPSFSTTARATEFVGDGDGLARVTAIVEEVFGTMTLETVAGRGTTFVVTVPAHRALQRARIFSAGGRIWGIPDSAVLDVFDLADVTVDHTAEGTTIAVGDEAVPYSSFASAAGLDSEGSPAQVMFLKSPTGVIAIAVDAVLSVSEVSTKDLGPLLSGSTVVSGAALLGGGETVMLVDSGRLADRMRHTDSGPEGSGHSVLIVDDSQGVRQVVSGVLASHGFSTVSAGSVSDALAALAKTRVDALIVDFSMPRADGVALIHMVRQRYGDIPVVMLSGVADEEDRARADRAGADAIFDKSDFAKGALVETLRELVTSGRPTSADIAS